MKRRHVLVGFVIAAVVGLGAFGLLARRSVTFESADADEALRRFSRIRDGFSRSDPILHVDESGHMVRSAAPVLESSPAKTFHVLAYRAAEHRLVAADVPFWFLKGKAPAVRFALRGTGLDLERLGMTPGELERYGAALILDENAASGDRLLIWTK